MTIFVILLIGIIIGLKCFPLRWKKWNEIIQLLITAVLIFVMGVSLGSRPNVSHDIIRLGWDSFLLAILPITFSVFFVYVLTKRFMDK